MDSTTQTRTSVGPAYLPETLATREIATPRATGRSIAARNALVQEHLGFVVRIAQEYRGMGVPLEDLVHEGILGLFEAANRFEPERGFKFLTFASWWVRKSLRAALTNGAAVVVVPGYQRRRMREIREAEIDLHARLGRRPADDEVSQRVGRSVERVRKTRSRHRREIYLDQGIGERGNVTLAGLLADERCVSQEVSLLRREATARLRREIDRLEGRERDVLVRRFGLDGEPAESLQEISDSVGLSRERVRQIEVAAKTKLRRRLARLRLAPTE